MLFRLQAGSAPEVHRQPDQFLVPGIVRVDVEPGVDPERDPGGGPAVLVESDGIRWKFELDRGRLDGGGPVGQPVGEASQPPMHEQGRVDRGDGVRGEGPAQALERGSEVLEVLY